MTLDFKKIYKIKFGLSPDKPGIYDIPLYHHRSETLDNLELIRRLDKVQGFFNRIFSEKELFVQTTQGIRLKSNNGARRDISSAPLGNIRPKKDYKVGNLPSLLMRNGKPIDQYLVDDDEDDYSDYGDLRTIYAVKLTPSLIHKILSSQLISMFPKHGVSSFPRYGLDMVAFYNKDNTAAFEIYDDEFVRIYCGTDELLTKFKNERLMVVGDEHWQKGGWFDWDTAEDEAAWEAY